jgi:hypothetical protein
MAKRRLNFRGSGGCTLGCPSLSSAQFRSTSWKKAGAGGHAPGPVTAGRGTRSPEAAVDLDKAALAGAFSLGAADR